MSERVIAGHVVHEAVWEKVERLRARLALAEAVCEAALNYVTFVGPVGGRLPKDLRDVRRAFDALVVALAAYEKGTHDA